ncbi:MAG: hypothetical protein J5545_12135 [Bacteroidaceae bacterium]|nr:hypothetical protein [Bacteroidaceae bacterium]
MKKLFLKDNVFITICIVFLLIQLTLYLYKFSGGLSSMPDDWAAFSTFFGLGFSFASALLIYLTYRSQTNMSSVLQFESIFFNWHQQHRSIYVNLKPQITDFSNQIVLPFIRNHQGIFEISDFRSHSNDVDQRAVIRYYRSLYHLLKYIHKSTILGDDKQKKKYVDIIQSQMSDEELNTVLYLLLADEWMADKRVLEDVSWLELVDKHHLLKNFYYSKDNPNFEEFKAFMHVVFPQTKASFYFLK